MTASIARNGWPAAASKPTTSPGSAKASGHFLEPGAHCRSNGAWASRETILRCAARVAIIGCAARGKRWTTTFRRGDARRSLQRWCANFEWDGGCNGARWRTHRSSQPMSRLRCSRHSAHPSAFPRAQCNCTTSPITGDIRRIAASAHTPVRVRIRDRRCERARSLSGQHEAHLNAQTNRVVDFVLFAHGDAGNGLVLARHRGCRSDQRPHGKRPRA